jgi:hypothetical protein
MAFALYDLVRTYPNSSITPYATEVLNNINEEYHLGLVLNDIQKEGADQPEVKKETPYTHEPNIEHFAMVVCNTKKVRVEPLKVRISDFNSKEYRVRTFNIKSVLLNDELTLITIGNFENEKTAKDYIESLFLSDYVFGGIDKEQYSVLPISIKNYPAFYQAKDLEEYQQFIKNN